MKEEGEVYESDWVFGRCLVDQAILDGALAIQFLYREEPEVVEGDKYPDTGWRIRGDYRGRRGDDLGNRETAYVAIGAVLNKDDGWVHLKDAPVGSAFVRNFETGEFEVEEGWGVDSSGLR